MEEAELFNVVCFVRCGEEENFFLWKEEDFAVGTEIAGWKPLHDDDAVDTRSSRGNNFIVLIIMYHNFHCIERSELKRRT